MEQERRTALIVDSSASSIFYTASLLRTLRYVVKSAPSGEEALEAIAHAAPTVVITDAVLPRMSGLDLLKQIKNNTSLRFIPIMINTADVNAANREACTQAGCAGYFTKPVDPEALYRAIQAATEATPRKNIRIAASLKARIGEESAAGGKIRTEEVTSLSIGGLYVKTAAPALVKTAIPLTLILGDREIKSTAIVMYSSEKAGGQHPVPGMGMKFSDIKDADVNAIREFIRASVMRDLKVRND